ncbi:ATP-binding protein [Brassicibacter mesophilus]|uniref:ATP-binding protein n=1 Tax=Brassicibacter mesophilus TaxID=745119 RepID=UPI003D23300D
MNRRLKSLKYLPGMFCGVISSSLIETNNNPLKGIISDVLNDGGCYICVYNSPEGLVEKKNVIKSWGMDYESLIENGKLVMISAEKIYLWDNKFDVDSILEYYDDLIKKCYDNGYHKIIIHSVRDDFYFRRTTIEQLYQFHKKIKSLAKDKEIMIFTKYMFDNFTEEHFYKLFSLHDMFVINNYDTIYSYGPEKFKEIETLFRFLKSDIVDRNALYREKNKLELINELILDMSYMQSGNELLNTSLKKLTDIVGVDFGYIISLMGENDSKDIIGRYNLPYGFLEELSKIKYDKNNTLEVSSNGVTIETSTRFKELQKAHISKKYGIKTVIKIPIKGKEKDINALILLFSSKDSVLFNEHMPFLEAVGSTMLALFKKQKDNEEYHNGLIKAEKLRALGELAGGIAHDFNNLLTAILGFSQIALTKQLDKEIKEYFEIIYKSALDGKAIVDKIQSFNRKHYNNIRAPHLLNSIVESSIEMARPRWKNTYESNGIRLEMIRELNSKSEIYCNEHEIREVVLNILMNAMDAMDNGGFLIIKTYDKANKVFIEIQDTGTGISHEIREKIFEPFFSTKEARGTGLGLSIVRRIVEDHDGDIELESELGYGSRFKISFNKHKSDKKIDKINTKTNELMKFDNLKALVIDDKEQVGGTIVKMLDVINVKAETELHSGEVMDRLSECKYDIIICDLAMPVMNGIEVAKFVKYRYPDIKFILMTGWPGGLQEDTIRYIDYVLHKPCTIDELASAVNSVILS